jgi:putative heme-binding domain-containing protein
MLYASIAPTNNGARAPDVALGKAPCSLRVPKNTLNTRSQNNVVFRLMNFAKLAFALFSLTVCVRAQNVPEWIWHPNNGTAPADNEVRYFRKTFNVDGPARRASLAVSADNRFTAFVNGTQVGSGTEWQAFPKFDIKQQIKPGENVIAIRAENEGGSAGMLAELDVATEEGTRSKLVTDKSWQTSASADAGWQTVAFQAGNGWVEPKSLGKLGVQPWGNIAAGAVTGGGKPATPAESITALDGFKVELLRSAQPGEGSWVAMAVDPQGRLIISPQGKEPMLRVSLDGKGQIANLEKLSVPISGAMGLLYAFDALYINGQGPEGYHLYRLRDTDGKGTYGEPELLRKWKGGPGEHGAHGIVLGPDNRLYIVNGNFVDVPDDILPTSPHKNYADDLILPRMEDGNGFGAGRKPPGGYVVRMDKDGKNCELFASGQRNTYDIAFNADGELFGFDSDMEWDWGTPWYRATRAYHIVSGGDQGFREGSAKWPTYYQDSLPEVVDIGIGSPTGVLVPTKANFPTRFRDAFWMMDWSYGRIVAAALVPRGATYTASFQTIIKGKPLNVTDMEVGPDRALYFATGGRGTQSGLYRLSYLGVPRNADVIWGPEASDARTIRHHLETFHGKQDPKAIATVWPHLKSDDRFIRYAARIAIESQPVSEWKSKALAEANPNAALTALLALSRVGSSADQSDVLNALGRFPTASLPEEQQLLKLRVIEVSIARHGRPADEFVQRGIEKLSPLYPAKSWPLNRELSQILIYLDAPGVVGKTLDLIAKAETQEEQLHYVVALRKANAWTLDERKRYFSWFQKRPAGQDAGPTYPAGGNYFISATAKHPAEFDQWFADVGLKPGNGASYNNFMLNLLEAAVGGLSESEQTQLGDLVVAAVKANPPGRNRPLRGALAKFTTTAPATAELKPQKEHKFVREWKMEDFANDLNGPSRGRDYASGREAYIAAQCAQCHRLNNEGGAIGPDLAGAGAKYTRRDLLESLLDPSKVISDQYQNMTVTKKDDEDVTGRVVEDTDTKLVLIVNPLTGEKVELKKSDVKGRAPSKLSPMPESLVNILTKEEILDLLAYMESAGNRQHAAFGK